MLPEIAWTPATTTMAKKIHNSKFTNSNVLSEEKLTKLGEATAEYPVTASPVNERLDPNSHPVFGRSNVDTSMNNDSHRFMNDKSLASKIEHYDEREFERKQLSKNGHYNSGLSGRLKNSANIR